MTQPPGYQLAKYDLTDDKQVLALGNELGAEWMKELMPLTKAMSMEMRILFLTALLGSPVGHACAAVGSEATQAMLDTLKMLALGIGDRNEKGSRQ